MTWSQPAGNVTEDNNSQRGAGYSINGQRSADTDILLDGGENVDLFTATVGQSVPLGLGAGIQCFDQQLHRGIWPQPAEAW